VNEKRVRAVIPVIYIRKRQTCTRDVPAQREAAELPGVSHMMVQIIEINGIGAERVGGRLTVESGDEQEYICESNFHSCGSYDRCG